MPPEKLDNSLGGMRDFPDREISRELTVFNRLNQAGVFPEGSKLNSHLEFLESEKDPEIFWEDLLDQAKDQMTHEPLVSYQFFSLIQSPRIPEDIKPSKKIQQKAKDLQSVLQGGGPTGARWEYLAKGLVKDFVDPALFIPFLGAGLVSNLARYGVLKRIDTFNKARQAVYANRTYALFKAAGYVPIKSLATRFFGHPGVKQMIASSAAFSVEVPSLFALSDLTNSIIHGEKSAIASGDFHLANLQSAYLVMMLGSLRFGGFLTRGLINPKLEQHWLARHYMGNSRFHKILFHSADGTGQLLGLWHFNKITAPQSRLTPDIPNDQAIQQSLLTLAQFRLGHFISRGFLGKKFGDLRAMEMKGLK